MFTYCVQSVLGGPIKIGKAKDIEKRLKALQTGSPIELQVVGLLEGDCERRLHFRFNLLREHGEWFTPDRELLEFLHFHSLKGQNIARPMGRNFVTRMSRR